MLLDIAPMLPNVAQRSSNVSPCCFIDDDDRHVFCSTSRAKQLVASVQLGWVPLQYTLAFVSFHSCHWHAHLVSVRLVRVIVVLYNTELMTNSIAFLPCNMSAQLQHFSPAATCRLSTTAACQLSCQLTCSLSAQLQQFVDSAVSSGATGQLSCTLLVT